MITMSTIFRVNHQANSSNPVFCSKQLCNQWKSDQRTFFISNTEQINATLVDICSIKHDGVSVVKVDVTLDRYQHNKIQIKKMNNGYCVDFKHNPNLTLTIDDKTKNLEKLHTPYDNQKSLISLLRFSSGQLLGVEQIFAGMVITKSQTLLNQFAEQSGY